MHTRRGKIKSKKIKSRKKCYIKNKLKKKLTGKNVHLPVSKSSLILQQNTNKSKIGSCLVP